MCTLLSVRRRAAAAAELPALFISPSIAWREAYGAADCRSVPSRFSRFIYSSVHGKKVLLYLHNHLLKSRQQKYFVTTTKCLVLSTKHLVAAAKFYLLSLILLP